MVDIAQQRGKSSHSASAWLKVVIAQQRGKSSHSKASWQMRPERSSVEKADIAQQR